MGDVATIDERRLESRLVEAMKRGDRAAFDTFVTRYTPVLLRFAHARVGDPPEDIQDLVQSTLTVAIERLETYRGDGALPAWLIGICRLQVGTLRRRRGVRERWSTEGPEDFDRLASPEPLQSRDLEEKEERALVHGTLESLPDPYGRVLEWKYLEGLPVQAIARRLEVSPKAAESLLTRARVSFRRVFDELQPDTRGIR